MVELRPRRAKGMSNLPTDPQFCRWKFGILTVCKLPRRPRQARSRRHPSRSQRPPMPQSARVRDTHKNINFESRQSNKPLATEDVSPITNKKAKSVKTPAKHKDTEVEAEPTPNTKKAKTPVKVKETSPKEVEETSAPKSSKKNKTPAKPKDTEKTLVQQTTTVDEPEKTPASKAKKNKTPAKSKVHETVITQEIEKTPASKAKTEKNLAKSKATEEDAPTETDKTPGTKSNKDKTPAKAKLAKDTPSKAAEQSTSKITENTPGKSKDQAKPGPQSTKKTPKSAKKSEPVEKTTIKDVQDEKAPKEDELVSSDEELDEQTKALIKTVDVEDVDGAQSGVVLFEEGQDVGKIPELSKKQRKKAQKELAGRSSKVKEDTGVIYIGRLPHGFYEHEMRSYFSQFGPIRNLRVARNKQTGKPKHFAFIEFEEASTAAIVAKTMDNYLLFGHILKCSVIPKAQIHDELFKGANKRFKVSRVHVLV